MISDNQNLETYHLDVPRSVSAECENARQYIAQITELEMRCSTKAATPSPIAIPSSASKHLYAHLPALSRLKKALNEALDAATWDETQPGVCDSAELHEKATEPASEPAVFEKELLRAADIRWLCNQCDYYFGAPSPLTLAKQSPEVRRKWQIRASKRSLNYVRMLTTIRNLWVKKDR